MGVEFVSVHNNAGKELSQYGAILTSSLVNNACIKQKLRSEKQWPGAIRLAVKFECPDNFNLSIQKNVSPNFDRVIMNSSFTLFKYSAISR